MSGRFRAWLFPPRCLNCGRTADEDAQVTRGQVCGRCVYPPSPNPYAVIPIPEDTRMEETGTA